MMGSDFCNDLMPFLKTIKIIIEIIRWSIPLLLIILGTFDLIKAITIDDEKAVKDAQTKFLKRLMYGVLVFLVPFAIDLVFSLANQLIPDTSGYTDSSAWITCWEEIDG